MFTGVINKKVIYSIYRRCLLFFLIIAVFTGTVVFQTDKVSAVWDYFNYAEALQKSLYFYDAQKCGPGVTGGRLEWRGDCHLKDSRISLNNTSLKGRLDKYAGIVDPDGDGCVDVHGGFHDAGDFTRFGFPQAYTASTLGWGFYEFRDAFVSTQQQEHMIEILKYFTDYFLRCSFFDKDGKLAAFCYYVGDPDIEHTYWGPPEINPDRGEGTGPDFINRTARFATAESPASNICAMTSAALALSYLNFKDTDDKYANKCLTYSKAMYDFAKENRGNNNEGGYYPDMEDECDLSWAAVWLYTCTSDRNYINDIDSVSSDDQYTGYLKKIMTSNLDTYKNKWVHAWSDVWGGVFIRLSAMFPNNKKYDYIARWNLEYWAGGKIPHDNQDDDYLSEITPAGFALLNSWGSARYNCGAQLSALVYQKYHPARTDFTDWARGQMEYLMGKNPKGYSYIVGYGQEEGLPSVKHPHHRAAHGSTENSMDSPADNKHTLWGALVGGPMDNDSHTDSIGGYICNEAAIDYNAAFVGASAGLYLLYGKDNKIIPDFPPKENNSFQYYCRAKLELDNSQRTSVDLMIFNESVHPPHAEKNIKVRYFFDISELISSRQGINDISFNFENEVINDGPRVAGPIKWDEAGTYYYELDWEEDEIYGKREVKFSISAAVDNGGKTPAYRWSSHNDYSRNGLNLVDYENAAFIPMYIAGERVFGGEPPKKSASTTATATPVRSTPANNTQKPPVVEPQQGIPGAGFPTVLYTATATPTLASTHTPRVTPTPAATPGNMRKKVQVVFRDIDKHWAKEFIEYSASLNLMSGMGNGVFAPDGIASRAECAKVVTVILNKYNEKSDNSVFSDVDRNDWFYSYISSSYDERIMIGNADGTFLPHKSVTREELALIFSRILTRYYSLNEIEAAGKKSNGKNSYTDYQSKKDTFELPFTDVGIISGYASDGVATVVNYGIMTGRPGNVFDPKGKTTRAELATMLCKLMSKYGDIF